MRVLSLMGMLAAGMLLTWTPVRAHHAFAAEFDANKPVKLTGVVTKIEWMNPHAYFYIDVKDAGGKVTNWGLEMGSPNGLMRQGWTRNSMKIGDEVTVEGSAAKFWEVGVSGPTLTVRFGRLGTQGQSKDKTCADKDTNRHADQLRADHPKQLGCEN